MRATIVATLIVVAACSSQPPSAELPPPPIPPKIQPANAPDAADVANGAYSFPLSISDAEHILMETDVFDVAGSGFRPGRQVQAFNVLLDERDALDRFRRLALKGRPVGQLYGLCGLLLLARAEGVTLAHSLSLNPADVMVRDGDYMFDTPAVRAIVLVFANDVPTRLRERRAEVYAYFSTK
jgi:hypothetical protein